MNGKTTIGIPLSGYTTPIRPITLACLKLDISIASFRKLMIIFSVMPESAEI